MEGFTYVDYGGKRRGISKDEKEEEKINAEERHRRWTPNSRVGIHIQETEHIYWLRDVNKGEDQNPTLTSQVSLQLYQGFIGLFFKKNCASNQSFIKIKEVNQFDLFCNMQVTQK